MIGLKAAALYSMIFLTACDRPLHSTETALGPQTVEAAPTARMAHAHETQEAPMAHEHQAHAPEAAEAHASSARETPKAYAHEAHEAHAHEHPKARVAQANAGADEASAAYACPMHPEVTSPEPGRCPECGMNLVLRKP